MLSARGHVLPKRADNALRAACCLCSVDRDGAGLVDQSRGWVEHPRPDPYDLYRCWDGLNRRDPWNDIDQAYSVVHDRVGI
jgi:hypothetical protein